MGKALLQVLKGEVPDRRPMWMMRQAGRYLPEYRALRATAGSFLNLCYNPEMAAEVSLQPLRRFDFDAAILFSDILVVPHALGLALRFEEGEGPFLDTVKDLAGIDALNLDAGRRYFEKVYETVQRVKLGLQPGHTLIGFCGAPWTVASYMVEGRSSDRQKALAAAMHAPWFGALIDRVVAASVEYALGQVKAGAECLQIFDSWAGDLPLELRGRWVEAPIRDVMNGVRAVYPEVPIIVFARGIGDGHGALASNLMPSAMGVEQGVDLAHVLKALPAGVAVQGNLSPEVLLSGGDVLDAGVGTILENIPVSRHIFNLGHGILPTTPIAHVERLVNLVRA